jgi:hypothetical protein
MSTYCFLDLKTFREAIRLIVAARWVCWAGLARCLPTHEVANHGLTTVINRSGLCLSTEILVSLSEVHITLNNDL